MALESVILGKGVVHCGAAWALAHNSFVDKLKVKKC